jgi:hypothetical protein
MRVEKKRIRIILLSILMGFITFSFFTKLPLQTQPSASFSREFSKLYGHSAFGFRGYSRQGDSITYSFDASANIWVYAMDEPQWNSFTEQNMLGIHLLTAASGSGIFYPQYESRWYIVFINYHSYSVSVTCDVSSSPIIRITNPTSSTQIFFILIFGKFTTYKHF